MYRKSDTIEIGFSGGAKYYLQANQIIIYRIFIYRMFLRGFMCKNVNISVQISTCKYYYLYNDIINKITMLY